MSNAVTLATLQKLARSLERTPDKLARAMATAGGEIGKLVADEFSTGTNPWGRPWPAPKDGGAPLVRSGSLKGSVSVSSSEGKITTKATAPYARNLQRGRRNFKKTAISHVGQRAASAPKALTRVEMRPRSIVPFKKLPPTWQLVLVQAISSELGDVA